MNGPFFAYSFCQAHSARNTNMSATHPVSGFSRPSRGGLAGGLIDRLSGRLRKLLAPSWLLFRTNDSADELVIRCLGPVEIHQTLPAWSLETCVKGQPDRARATAVHRLGSFVRRKNRSGMRLRVARPLVQSAEGSNRWRLRIALPGLASDFAAASVGKGKVRLQARDSETLAILRLPGRPTELAIQHAETAIRYAIAPTHWQPAGGAMLRLHTLPAMLPFLGRFEVAVPVVERMHGSATPEWMRRAVFEQPAGQDRATRSSPPVR